MFEELFKNKNEWKKLHFKWYSDSIDPIAKKLCPKSCKIIESVLGLKLAMFSVLAPGAKILPHSGHNKGCLRYHLGVVTPNSDDCFIVVKNKKYSWKDG